MVPGYFFALVRGLAPHDRAECALRTLVELVVKIAALDTFDEGLDLLRRSLAQRINFRFLVLRRRERRFGFPLFQTADKDDAAIVRFGKPPASQEANTD